MKKTISFILLVSLILAFQAPALADAGGGIEAELTLKVSDRMIEIKLTTNEKTTNGKIAIDFDPGLVSYHSSDSALSVSDVIEERDRLTFGYACSVPAAPGDTLTLISFYVNGGVDSSNNVFAFTFTPLEFNDTLSFGEEASFKASVGASGSVITPGGGAMEIPIEETPTDGGHEDCPSLRYSDLDTGAWYHEYADYVLENGIMDGTGDGIFEPGKPLSRAMLVTMLYRAEGKPAVTGAAGFTDVAEGVWYADAVAWASANGIVEGYGEGIFAPGAAISRQEAAVILWRYARYKGYDVSNAGSVAPAFDDLDQAAPWAREAMVWANLRGVITGRTETALAPLGGATRIEAAAMLVRLLRLPGGETV